MTWVKRTTVPTHSCAPPMRQVIYLLGERTDGTLVTEWPATEVDGQLGELWRCGCRRLWRVADACDACDFYGGDRPHRGQCTRSLTWRPARLSQRLRHWRHGKEASR